MTAFDAIQGVIIGALVLGSLGYVVRRFLPGPTTHWMAALSARFNKPWHSPAVRWLGRRLQPRQATGNCGDGCGTCGACGPARPADAVPGDARPLHFRPRRRPDA